MPRACDPWECGSRSIHRFRPQRHRLDESAGTTWDGQMATKPAPVAFGPYTFIWDGRGYVPDPASWPTDLPATPPEVERLVQAAKRG
jgi:hypothetical protein